MNIEVIKRSIEVVMEQFSGSNPAAGMILGSGWNEAISPFKVLDEISYSDLPALGKTSVSGHKGALVRCEYQGKEILVFRGRRHVFEGVDSTALCFPSLLLSALKTPIVIVTNAAGSLSKEMKPGDVMLITDHINLLGTNPLIGANRELFPEVFIDMSEPYDPKLREICTNLLDSNGVCFKQGVYAAVHGPSYETKSEVKMLAHMGANAVGMSTVPTVITARALGMRVLALSCISNFGTGIADQALNHQEVLDAGESLMPKMALVFSSLVETI